MKQVRKNGAGIHISAGLSGYVAELIPAMLQAFIDGDRGFARRDAT
ncbi:DUF2274 domain-containing protein [Novosphingobium sp. LASN5T]|nr:DUF2274 domain-containing protein [Novosphingobium sp. LASN5T]